MELIKIETEKVQQLANQSFENDLVIRDLTRLELVLVGGGMGDVQF